MTRDLQLSCKCGEVHGLARDVSEATVNRVVCLCADCQTFAHHLGRGDLLDAHGGSDVIQVAPDTVSYDRGTDRIAALRLSPKGVYRWHATCCKTPLGNTVEPKLPFIGFLYEAFKDARDPSDRDAVFGPARGAVNGQSAIGEPPPGSTGFPLRVIARSAACILGWKIRGRAWPHPYFDSATRAPKYPVTVLTREEREAARKLSGARGA